jgi:hypothetical protein
MSTRSISEGTLINITMAEFQNSVSYESWDQVFDGDDVNKIFNCFLKTYLRIFYASFPLKKINNESNTSWITIGIKLLHTEKNTVQTPILKGIINAIVTYYPKSLNSPKNTTMIITLKILLIKIKQHGT